jgi:hypothetical protein
LRPAIARSRVNRFLATEPFKALGFSACDLAVDQQAKPFGVAKLSSAVLRLQFAERFGHTIEPQGLQVIEGWMGKHDVSFQWK